MQKPAFTDDSPSLTAPRAERARELVMMGALICIFTCGAETRADDRQVHLNLDAPRDARLNGIAPEFDIGSLSVPDVRRDAPPQFSPRKSFAPDQPLEVAADPTQSLRTTTIWQRLNDYRSKDRVRLVTLWETSGSSVSLQAGKHGEPSLQWTSRAMNRGGATRGLLDHLVAASLGAAGVAVSQPGGNRSPIGIGSAVSVRPVRASSAIAAALNHAP